MYLILLIQNDQPPTFWKYNFIPHMAECHLIDNKLPPLPEEFKMATHISRAEEESMGVELIYTERYRKKYGLDNTSDFEHPTGPPEVLEDNVSLDEIQEEETQEGRKRAYSVLSKTSTTASRVPPTAKVART